ncbi:MAG: GIY-YIG nuclease family protein [candidate division Zixibacteria bacterium]|nr:GIY-YIG nuclease family protein [candidate division Zixibacteria bacterium]
MAKGIYQLRIHLPKNALIVIGKKGRWRFPKGYYVYTGSARNGLEKRVERHLKKNKKHFWHIDYLLDFASIKEIFFFTNGKFDECALNLKMLEKPEAKIIMPKFGASDCGCPAHLVFFEKMPKSRMSA